MSLSPDARPAQRLDRQDETRRGADAADLLDREAQGQQVRAQPAVPLGERDAQDVVARQQPPDVLGPGGVPVDVGGSGSDLRVGQLAHRIAQEDLVLREADRAVGRGVRRHRNAS